MLNKLIATGLVFMLAATVSFAQSLDGNPYRPGIDADIDMFINHWQNSMPMHTHGSLVERPILTTGDPMEPPRKGAVLKYINRYAHATLDKYASTTPTTLTGEQEIFYIISGNGTLTAGEKTTDLYSGIAVLMPAGLEFTMTNTGDEALTMYLINEPIPSGFRPNKEMLVRDENAMAVASYNGHWCHIVKYLFETKDGLGTLERVLTVAFDPMTIGHPHSHNDGCEEVWTALKGESIALIGKQIRMQPEGTAYMIPPDGKTPHANVNQSSGQTKMFYFARYLDHEVRP